MKIIIAGGRDFEDYNLLKEKCDKILSTINEKIIIVSGCAKGADMMGEKYANDLGHQIVYFSPNWRLYGSRAGPVRNREMVEYADSLILFWNGVNKDSVDMLEKAKEKNLSIRVIKY